MDAPSTYCKKPVQIQAWRLTMDNAAAIMVWINDHYEDADIAVMRGGNGGGAKGATLYIETLEGTHHASIGDWVIRGVHHEFYPCKPDIFEATYAKVGERTGLIGVGRPVVAETGTERPQ